MNTNEEEYEMVLLQNKYYDLELENYKIIKSEDLLKAKIEILKELFVQSSDLGKKFQAENEKEGRRGKSIAEIIGHVKQSVMRKDAQNACDKKNKGY